MPPISPRKVGHEVKPVRHQFCYPDFATLLSIFVLPLPLGEGRGEGAFVESSAAEGTLTRPAAGLSQRERQDRQLSFGGAHTVPNTIDTTFVFAVKQRVHAAP